MSKKLLSIFLLTLFLLPSLLSSPDVPPSTLSASSSLPQGYLIMKHVIDVSRGIVIGVFSEMLDPYVCVCFENIGKVFITAEQIMGWIQYRQGPTALDIILILKDVVIVGLASYDECAYIPAAFTNLYTIFKDHYNDRDLKFWSQLGKNFVAEALSIMADIEDIRIAFQNGDYVMFGKEIGSILYALFLMKFDKP